MQLLQSDELCHRTLLVIISQLCVIEKPVNQRFLFEKQIAVHVAVRLFSNRSQMMSKYGMNISDTLGQHFFVLTTFDVICDLLLNRRTATFNPVFNESCTSANRCFKNSGLHSSSRQNTALEILQSIFITYRFSRGQNFQKPACLLNYIIYYFYLQMKLIYTCLDIENLNRHSILQGQIHKDILILKTSTAPAREGKTNTVAYNVCIFRRQRGDRVGVS